jgi:hypothetical protein
MNACVLSNLLLITIIPGPNAEIFKNTQRQNVRRESDGAFETQRRAQGLPTDGTKRSLFVHAEGTACMNVPGVNEA